jgi:putative ABC transport system ATP-binding protein
MPRSATVRARTDASAISYTAQTFREKFGATGMGELIGQHAGAGD